MARRSCKVLVTHVGDRLPHSAAWWVFSPPSVESRDVTGANYVIDGGLIKTT